MGLANLTITISGPHGTGKSTYAGALAEEFGLRLASAGQLFRQMAASRGMSLEELSELAKHDERIDRDVDARMREEAKRGSVVLEGHLAGWIAGSLAHLKVFLTAPERVRLERISQREGVSPAEARKLLELEEAEAKRWKRLYGVDVRDLSIYDVVVNTALMPAPLLVGVLKELVRGYAKGKAG